MCDMWACVYMYDTWAYALTQVWSLARRWVGVEMMRWKRWHARAVNDTRLAALEALGRAGAHAVLSGHVHDPFDLPAPAGGRTLRLIGAGTLSERVRATRPSFNELRIEGKALETRVHAMD